MRQRIARFTAKGSVQQWSEKLSQGWVSANTSLAGMLYIDGQVKIYNGHATHMLSVLQAGFVYARAVVLSIG